MTRAVAARRLAAWRPLTLLLAVVASFLAGPMGMAADEAPEASYRILEWADLVPEGWEPPLVAQAHDHVEESVDRTASVSDLDGQLAALPGYMKPIAYEGTELAEFLLVPFLPHQLRGHAHAHLEANQMVYVRLLDPVSVPAPHEPVWIVGALSTEGAMTAEGPVAYRMVEAVLTAYEY